MPKNKSLKFYTFSLPLVLLILFIAGAVGATTYVGNGGTGSLKSLSEDSTVLGEGSDDSDGEEDSSGPNNDVEDSDDEDDSRSSGSSDDGDETEENEDNDNDNDIDEDLEDDEDDDNENRSSSRISGSTSPDDDDLDEDENENEDDDDNSGSSHRTTVQSINNADGTRTMIIRNENKDGSRVKLRILTFGVFGNLIERQDFELRDDEVEAKIKTFGDVGEGSRVLTEIKIKSESEIEDVALTQGLTAVSNVELENEDDELIYKVSGEKPQKFLGVFDVEIPTEIFYTANGLLIETTQTFWSRILDFLSF